MDRTPQNRPSTAAEAVSEPTPPEGPLSRRTVLTAMLAAGATAVFGGCSGTGHTTQAMPGPLWPETTSSTATASIPSPAPTQSPVPAGQVIPRSAWAAGPPVPALMNGMRPVRYVTVHHSAGPLFFDTGYQPTVTRLESIRRYHRERGWGDIGYHYLVDRSGRVWEGRSLRWQGAHVKDHNEGNIGVVVLGDFDRQAPTPQQIDALTRHLRTLMRRHRLHASRLRTHQEWAATACPGRSLQRHIASSRARGLYA